ncbi:NADH dehydrogenase subunit 5 (mitochondrion) [Fragariocoptes setiger]|uniref:NADH-ubiquinone oxidoreductase chain 5 n=1 Tax=Fragariocoptes setiger TaxID=1670756 RepID=A0ABQ7SDE9_9ACAR|nr:NADH dehydrogenase subunit 5 [Fragariocoptes setiger]
MSFMVFTSLVSMTLLSSSELNGIMMELKIMNMLSSSLSFSVSMDKTSLSFMMMISMVTCSVLPFSTMYMESYNKKKKFFLIMMMFLSSMMILITSESLISTVTGWDMLGVTSIALIMMYQNQKTMMNSMLTMFFNRIGDFLMFFSIMMFMNNMEEKFCNILSMNSKSLTNLSIALMLTSMTKSAQVPLSAWLPAAMSAPTPISAMVHSSTLVTAGIYIILKMNESMKDSMWMLTSTTSITLMLASMAANMETDLKKIIAFSTMSQISIIMMMISMNMKTSGMMHMINHAMFKTLLFMTAGSTFLKKWMEQDSRKTKSSKTMNKLYKSSLTSSIVSMSGIPFSCSFFSKDKFLEEMKWENKNSAMSFIMAASSLATVKKNKKILQSMKNDKMNSASIKKMSIQPFSIMSMVTITIGSVNTWTNEYLTKPILYKMEIKMNNLMIFSIMMNEMKSKMKKTKMWSNNMMFMKWWSSNFLLKVNKKTKHMEMMDFLMTSKIQWNYSNKMSLSKLSLSLSISTILLASTLMTPY